MICQSPPVLRYRAGAPQKDLPQSLPSWRRLKMGIEHGQGTKSGSARRLGPEQGCLADPPCIHSALPTGCCQHAIRASVPQLPLEACLSYCRGCREEALSAVGGSGVHSVLQVKCSIACHLSPAASSQPTTEKHPTLAIEVLPYFCRWKDSIL